MKSELRQGDGMNDVGCHSVGDYSATITSKMKRDMNRLGIDAVPHGWKLSSVGKECVIRNDLRFPISVEVRRKMMGNYPYYGPTGVIDYIDEFRVDGDFTLIGEDGDHFLDHIYKQQTVRVRGRFNVNNHAHLVAGGIDCSVDWFFHFFRNRDISSYLTRQGAGRFKLTKQALEGLPILLPSRSEQSKIVEILLTWDEAIEKLAALRAAKESRLDGLRNILMARASRTGQPATFGTFLSESRVSGGDGTTARKISVRLYGKGAVEKFDPRGGSANTRYYRRKAGQLIWSKLDFLNGAFAILGDDLDNCESTLDLPAFDCAPSVNPQWLIQYLIRPAYYTKQVHLARGQRKARRIAPEDWLASPIHLPDRTTQDRIVEILVAARIDLDSTAREIEALARQKRGLMQKLLTGKWRIAIDETVAAGGVTP